LRPLLGVGALFVCLILAGLGFTLSHGGSSPASSSSVVAGPAEAPSAAASSSAAAGGEQAGSSAASSAAGAAPELAGGNGSTSFSVTASGTKYQQAILAGQVRANLAANKGQSFGAGVPAPTATVPAASASATSTAVVPSSTLRGCVLQLTNGKAPRLVDRATYQGKPAYVIASSSRVWVVGLGCTADKTELITSVPLAS
jgi:hypothetical protein